MNKFFSADFFFHLRFWVLFDFVDFFFNFFFILEIGYQILLINERENAKQNKLPNKNFNKNCTYERTAILKSEI